MSHWTRCEDCQCIRAAHTLADGRCRNCPACDGWSPEADEVKDA